tara:strand:- start:486 stop:1301 length:816 start_codon:yes stop_codon:yes gene_type:complete
MKITKKQLKKIIKEELEKVLKESWDKPGFTGGQWTTAASYGLPKRDEDVNLHSFKNILEYVEKLVAEINKPETWAHRGHEGMYDGRPWYNFKQIMTIDSLDSGPHCRDTSKDPPMRVPGSPVREGTVGDPIYKSDEEGEDKVGDPIYKSGEPVADFSSEEGMAKFADAYARMFGFLEWADQGVSNRPKRKSEVGSAECIYKTITYAGTDDNNNRLDRAKTLEMIGSGTMKRRNLMRLRVGFHGRAKKLTMLLNGDFDSDLETLKQFLDKEL